MTIGAGAAVEVIGAAAAGAAAGAGVTTTGGGVTTGGDAVAGSALCANVGVADRARTAAIAARPGRMGVRLLLMTNQRAFPASVA